MFIRKIQFIPTFVLAGLALSMAYSPVRADDTKDGAKATTTMQGGLLPGETREQKRERLLQGIEAQVGTLAPAQRTHILAILQAAGDEMAAARANTSLTDEQKSNVVRRVHGEISGRISAALTEAQMAKYKDNQGGMGVSDTAEQRRERLLKRYEKISDLNVKQKSELMALADASAKEVDVVRAKTTFTAQQKQDAIQKIHTDNNTKVDAVLTKSQQQEWNKIQAEYRGQRTDRTATRTAAATR
ncbi:hypothetical protein EON83_14315 [bacterium]|nr:MAG: hypothetical protein EON83_14315 [bacterium]